MTTPRRRRTLRTVRYAWPRYAGGTACHSPQPRSSSRSAIGPSTACSSASGPSRSCRRRLPRSTSSCPTTCGTTLPSRGSCHAEWSTHERVRPTREIRFPTRRMPSRASSHRLRRDSGVSVSQGREKGQSLTAMAYEHVRASILRGELPVGTVIAETRLADQLGISKTPVREALQLLRTEGLLETGPRRQLV